MKMAPFSVPDGVKLHPTVLIVRPGQQAWPTTRALICRKQFIDADLECSPCYRTNVSSDGLRRIARGRELTGKDLQTPGGPRVARTVVLLLRLSLTRVEGPLARDVRVKMGSLSLGRLP
jgi:hypothetical protein